MVGMSRQRETAAVLHDGSVVPVQIRGSGPALLVPVRVEPYDPSTAATMALWGADPDLGESLVAGLEATHQVITCDYEGHRMAHPAVSTLTPENLVGDLLAIADAAGADRFAYYGYSWLALAGLQLAVRSQRLTALAMGGFPPVDGPYAAMLAVTRAAHAEAVAQVIRAATAPPGEVVPEEVAPGDWDAATIQVDPDQTQQFVTLYEHLQDFDDAGVAASLTMPRLTFAGSEDTIVYSPKWGDATVEIAGPIARHRSRLVEQGWRVRLLQGLEHIGAMNSSNALPVLRDWLDSISGLADPA